MKDIVEVRRQIQANPNAVLQVWPTFTDSPYEDPRDALLWGYLPTSGEIVLRVGRYPMAFKAKPGPFEIEPASALIITPGPARMKHWGLTKLDAHTWGVSPSIHLTGAFHGYVTLCDVPDPAPWETR